MSTFQTCRSVVRAGFTLLELLVVVTIIVILLSLLTPALDSVIYQAELTKCAANLNTIAKGSVVYASGNKQYFPYRSAVSKRSLVEAKDAEGQIKVNETVYGAAFRKRRVNTLAEEGQDDRQRFAEYIPLKSFLDPMSGGGELDLTYTTPDTTYIMSDYALLVGMEWDRWGSMKKMGTKMLASGHRYSVLAADLDVDGSSLPDFRSWASHPDKDGLATQVVRNNVGGVIDSGWVTYGNTPRSDIDFNSAYWDGSTHRELNVRHDEWMNSQEAAEEGRSDPEYYTHRFADMPYQANGDWGRGAIQLWKEDGEPHGLHTKDRTNVQVNP